MTDIFADGALESLAKDYREKVDKITLEERAKGAEIERNEILEMIDNLPQENGMTDYSQGAHQRTEKIYEMIRERAVGAGVK